MKSTCSAEYLDPSPEDKRQIVHTAKYIEFTTEIENNEYITKWGQETQW